MPQILDDSDYSAATRDLLPPDKMAKMSLAELEDARQGKPKEVQDKVAPYAHRAFTRMVGEDGLGGAAATALAIPVYTAAKALGVMKNRSSASVEEMKQGYIGLGEGLMKRFKGGK